MNDTSTNAQKWNFNFNIDLGDAARGKRKGDDKSQKYILCTRSYRHVDTILKWYVYVCIKNYNVAYRKKKNIYIPLVKIHK